MEDLDPSQVSVLAAAVDPRIRQLKFLSDENKEEVIERRIIEAGCSSRRTNRGSGASESQSKEEENCFDILLWEETADSGPKFQVEQFFAEKSVKRDADLLDW